MTKTKSRCMACAGKKKDRRCRRLATWNRINFSRTSDPMQMCAQHRREMILIGHPLHHFYKIQSSEIKRKGE